MVVAVEQPNGTLLPELVQWLHVAALGAPLGNAGVARHLRAAPLVCDHIPDGPVLRSGPGLRVSQPDVARDEHRRCRAFGREHAHLAGERRGNQDQRDRDGLVQIQFCRWLPNAWDVPSALAYLAEGFTAIGTTSFGVSSSGGHPDGLRPADAESVVAQYDRVLDALTDKLPAVAEHLDTPAPIGAGVSRCSATAGSLSVRASSTRSYWATTDSASGWS